ncbi:MAG: glycosyltransferase [Bacteroidaceae bacterium]
MKEEDPLLSIIIPFYNLEEWLLKRCLTSIFCQQLDSHDYEIILVDDGSDVSPLSLIESYKRENLFYYRQVNKGLGAARNSGMKRARGEYLLFVDSDDYLYANTLHHCINRIKEQKVDILSFDFMVCKQSEIMEVKQKSICFTEKTSGAAYSLAHNVSGCAWLYMFKKELSSLHSIWFTEGIFHEDEEFTPKLYFFAKEVVKSNLIVYAYYRRDNSIITSKGVKYGDRRLSDFLYVLQQLLIFRDEQKENSSLPLNGLDRRIHFLSIDFIRKAFRESNSFSFAEREINRLKEKGLYPLAIKSYTSKYKLYCRLANTRVGLYILYLLEKLIKK